MLAPGLQTELEAEKDQLRRLFEEALTH
jgi:hydroxyacid-oxoacid transhydrogenase